VGGKTPRKRGGKQGETRRADRKLNPCTDGATMERKTEKKAKKSSQRKHTRGESFRGGEGDQRGPPKTTEEPR